LNELMTAVPETPIGVEDRAADVWEPLLAVAESVEGDWPKRARAAAAAMVATAKETNPSLGIQLLADIRTVFRDDKRLPTALLLPDISHLPQPPRKTINKGLPFPPPDLPRHLREYDIRSHTLKSFKKKGYSRAHFEAAWRRSPPPSLFPKNAVTAVTIVT